MRSISSSCLAALAMALLSLSAACAQPAAGDPAPNAVAFMAQNALGEGVQSLPTGVQYKILKSGPVTGPHPTLDDMVKVNYEGKLINGQVFDSSFKDNKPITFKLGNLIPGWGDVVPLMRPGDEWLLYIPPSRGYGDEKTGPIPAKSVLIFRLQLIAVGADAGAPNN